MSPRKSNPDAHEALIEAARDEFARRGVEGARVEDIARRAGVSKGAFYLHFHSKEGVFREILQRFLGVLADYAVRREDLIDARAITAPDFRSILERECASDVELLEALWRNRKIVAALDGAVMGPAAPLVHDFRRRMRSLVAARIEDRQRDGTLRTDLDPHALGDIILGAYEAFARRMVDLKEKPDLASWARVFQVSFYEGTLAPGVHSALHLSGRGF
jgi:AcrR family transcriptional regulator